jgi:REP-associated tyrosine transposase
MARLPRDDRPGAWWHQFNRGIAKRAVFETARDVERVLALVGEATERGEIEVHAYSVLTTQYHLLARSPSGDISEAMHRVGLPFVRWFNRSRRRDGPLFRGRFGGRRIDDGSYWLTVLRSIDLDAPRAGLCALPSDHPHGSARSYRRGTGPCWLARQAVERAVGDVDPAGTFRAENYDAFASSSSAASSARPFAARCARRVMHSTCR